MILYHEALQMLEMIKQKALQLLGSYGACKFSQEKPFNYKPLKLPSEHNYVYDAYVVTRANT